MRPLLLCLFFCTAVILQAQDPNIIFILTDDLGYGDLACQGAPDMRTPNIDRLSDEGLTFTQFYANCPVCSPSRASLLTGRFPDLVGVPGVIRQIEENSWGYFKPDATTLPEVLKSAGYHTGMVGKWHLGYESPNLPNDRGFDQFKGFLGDMMNDYWTHLRAGVNWMRDNGETIDPEGHATDLFTDWAIEYVDRQRNQSQPFFLYLAYNAPHFPIQPPPSHVTRVFERESTIDSARAKNVAFIEHLDENIGRLTDELENWDLLENTLIIFTSDNGGATWYAQRNEPMRGAKQQMYEGGIRVPTFAMWKGKINPGTTNNVGVLMDWMPTLAGLVTAPIDQPIDGISLLPTLMGSNQSTDQRYLFWVRREGGHYGGQAYYAARYGDYKILQNSAFEPMQLYKVGTDPFESTAIPIEDNEIFLDLRDALKEHIRATGGIPWQDEK